VGTDEGGKAMIHVFTTLAVIGALVSVIVVAINWRNR
jgi:hypothetical protein